MLEYMELLAVFEASNRRMLPESMHGCPWTSSRSGWPSSSCVVATGDDHSKSLIYWFQLRIVRSFAERRDVDHAQRLVDRAHLRSRVAVRVRAPPRAGPRRGRAGAFVPEVKRRPFRRLVVPTREEPSSTSDHSGRAIVTPIAASSTPVSAASSRGARAGRAGPGTGPSSRSCSA